MNNTWYRWTILGVLIVYSLLCYLWHPWLGYMLDSDGVAYLTIAERVANGEYWQSVNGLWSPLQSWLIAPWVGSKTDTFIAAKWINISIGAVLLILINWYLRSFSIYRFSKQVVMWVMAFVISYYVYFQLFADVLVICFFILLLKLLSTNEGKMSIYKSIGVGIIIGIGFYAKAYMLFGGVLIYTAWMLWSMYEKKSRSSKDISLWILSIGITLLFTIPWSIILYQKYHLWTFTGLAGKLNMSWYINSGKTFHDTLGLMIPPPYADSPSFWEDPFWSQGKLFGPSTSVTHFVKWLMRIGHTMMEYVFCMNEISTFAIITLLFSLYQFLLKENNTTVSASVKMAVITLTLFPLGYWMMHIETRYIWLLTPLLMIVGCILIQYHLHHLTEKIKKRLILFFAVSFMVYPAWSIESLRHKNKYLFELSDSLNQHHVKGKFCSNMQDSGPMWVVAYLTDNQYYTIEKSNYSFDEWWKECIRWKIDYYVEYTENKFTFSYDTDKFEKIIQHGNYTIYKLNCPAN
jgi:Dolichyl-phosphate-mannose-protein mannosyltransferase.